MDADDFLKSIGLTHRLSSEQEAILCKMAMNQDEHGWQPSRILAEKAKENEALVDMVEKELVESYTLNPGGRHEIVCMFVSSRGARYYSHFANEFPLFEIM